MASENHQLALIRQQLAQVAETITKIDHELRAFLNRLPGEDSETLTLPRNPDGWVNNCAVRHGYPAESCQMCGGRCPGVKV